VVTADGRVYTRRVRNRLKERGVIVCMSDNPDKTLYPDFSLYAASLHHILRVEWYFAAEIPNIHESYYAKMERLEDNYNLMQLQLNEINERLKEGLGRRPPTI
jgi:hypothetical protein